MKNAVLTFVMLFSVALMAQEENIKPTFEKDGDIITATYFHENGEIAQTGEMLNNKPHGKWEAYDVEGNKTAVAYYNKGVKTGKWFIWSADKLAEVDYRDNTIINVVNWDKTNTLVKN